MANQNKDRQINQGIDAAKTGVKATGKGAKAAGKGAKNAYRILPPKVRVFVLVFLIVICLIAAIVEGTDSSSFKRVYRQNAIYEQNDYNRPKTDEEYEASVYKKDTAIEDTLSLVQIIEDAKLKDYDNATAVARAQLQKTFGGTVDVNLSIQLAKQEASEDSGLYYCGSSGGVLAGTRAEGAVAWAREYAAKDKYGYKRWTANKNTHKCPICHPGSGDGWNCIGFCTAAYFHGAGLTNITCSNSGFGDDNFFTRVTEASWRKKHGPDWMMISNGSGKGGADIPASALQPGDVLICYNSKGVYKHLELYLGNGETAGSLTDKYARPKQIQVRKYSELKKNHSVSRAFRYTGGGMASGFSAGYTPYPQKTVLETITNSTGRRVAISSGKGSHGVAQSFALSGNNFIVSFTTGPVTGVQGYIKAFSPTGKPLANNTATSSIYHANGSAGTPNGTVLVGGTMASGKEKTVKVFSYKEGKLTSKGEKKLPIGASSLAYDKDTNKYILGRGSSMTVYDGSLKTNLKTIKRNIHGKYYQDLGAGRGYIFACHSIKKGGENSGKNAIDIYSETTGDYCGTYMLSYGELESAEILNGELVLLVHIKGTSQNYIHFTGIKVGTGSSGSSFFSSYVSKLNMDILSAYNISISNTALYADMEKLNKSPKGQDGIDPGSYYDVRGKDKGKVTLYWFGENRGMINYEKDLKKKFNKLLKEENEHFYKVSIGSGIEEITTIDEEGNTVKAKIVPVTIKESKIDDMMEPLFDLPPDEKYINSSSAIAKTKDKENAYKNASATNLQAAYTLSDTTGHMLFGDLQTVQADFGAMDMASGAIGQTKITSPKQAKIISYINTRWGNRNPYYSGYQGLCEAWVHDVYRGAGLGYSGSCCANAGRHKFARKTGQIPPGAVIYGGDSYQSSYTCEVCGRNCGHVAIYLGNGIVAGSQYKFKMSLRDWTKAFGYGGWSYNINSF